MRPVVDVARRCLCLELLAQRSVLEADATDRAGAEAARAKWASRLGDLGITLSEEERALFERPVGALSEDERDDLDGRSAGAAVLLWALGRTGARPTFASADAIVADHGLLATSHGSIAKARAAAEGASLRPEPELDDALSTYRRARGKAKEPGGAEQIYAGIAAHHLTWIVEDAMNFDDDLDLD